MSKPLAVGDRVAFSASFLRNTGQSFEAAQMRGTVGQIDDIGGSHLCRVNWDEGCPTSVLDTNLAGAFNRIRDEGVISATTAATLCRAVGLRNVVAHGYAGINPAMVHAAATRGLGDLEVFAREVAQWISARSKA